MDTPGKPAATAASAAAAITARVGGAERPAPAEPDASSGATAASRTAATARSGRGGGTRVVCLHCGAIRIDGAHVDIKRRLPASGLPDARSEEARVPRGLPALEPIATVDGDDRPMDR